MIDFVSILASLVIALISVGVSHLILQKNKFRSNFKGMLTELEHNLSTLEDIKTVLDEDEKAMKDGKVAFLPLLRLSTFAFDYFVLEGHMMRLHDEDKQFLMRIYKLFQAINEYLKYYEETKLGVLYVTPGGQNIREGLLQILKTVFIPEAESMVKKFIQKWSN